MPRLGRATPQRGAHLLPALPTSRNLGALTQWGTALSGLNSSAAKWLAIGADGTEGQGASTRANRWIDQALATIRTSKSVTGGQGWVSAAYQVTGPNSPWATSQVAYLGGASAATTAGVGYRYAILPPAGSVTFTIAGNAVDLWFIAEATSGTLSYRVDAGPTTTIATAGTHDIRQVAGIGLGGTGSHTVTVTAAAGTVYITGLMVYSGDAGTGVQLYDAARVGVTSGMYAGSSTDLADVVSTVAPDLVTIELGINDAGVGIMPIATVANIQTIVTALRGLPKVPSIILVIPPYPAMGSGGLTVIAGFGLAPFGTSPFGSGVITPPVGWPDYVIALRRMAAVDSALAVLDLSLSLPAADTTGTGLYQTDGRNLNDSGHAAAAAQFVNFANLGVTVAPASAGRGQFFLMAGAA